MPSPYPERLQSKKTDWETFLKKMRDLYVDIYEPAKLISNSAYMLGEYDFFFEWDQNPARAGRFVVRARISHNKELVEEYIDKNI